MSSRDTYTQAWRGHRILSEDANRWRALGGISAAWTFNIVSFFHEMLVPGLRLQRNIKLRLYRSGLESRLPAEVDFETCPDGSRTATLHILRHVWEQAERGLPDARFIVAHEFAHLILHDHGVRAFSRDEALLKKFAPLENSVEWQANTWASYFLLTDDMLIQQVRLCRNEAIDAVVELCQVMPDVVQGRLDLIHKQLRRLASLYVGQVCSKCANFTLVRDGVSLKCDTCGSTMSCS